MRGFVGRYAWWIDRRWPFFHFRKLPPMTRLRWWRPEVIETNRKDQP